MKTHIIVHYTIFIYFQVENIVTVRHVIQCALSKKHRDDVVLKEWYSQSEITRLLIDVAKEIASCNYSDLQKNQDLILLAFEPLDNGSKSLIYNYIVLY